MSSITRFQFEQMQVRLGHPPRTLPPPLEKELHREIMDHCDKQWPRWKYIHSRTDKRTRNEEGVPDFIIALPLARTLYVEAKRPGEKPSLAQRNWHAEMAKLGHAVFIVHNFPEFLAAVETARTQFVNPNYLGQPMSNPPPL